VIGVYLGLKSMNLVLGSMIPKEVCFNSFATQLMTILKAHVATGVIYTIIFGHMLDGFVQTLGDFEYVNTTAGTIYPVVKIIKDGNSSDKEVDSTIEVTSPDHVALTGKLNSGAIASIIVRGGIKPTDGRRGFLWEIDGEDGSIRVEGTSIAITTFRAAVLIAMRRTQYIRYRRLQRLSKWEACSRA
jgi:predicted dehydrogenase